MKWILIKRLAKIGLLIFGLTVVADIAVISLVDFGRKSPDFSGCFVYDAMLIGFKCQGFPAAGLVTEWINWPFMLIYAPLFAPYSIKMAIMAVLVWSPLILYVVSAHKLARKNA